MEEAFYRTSWPSGSVRLVLRWPCPCFRLAWLVELPPSRSRLPLVVALVAGCCFLEAFPAPRPRVPKSGSEGAQSACRLKTDGVVCRRAASSTCPRQERMVMSMRLGSVSWKRLSIVHKNAIETVPVSDPGPHGSPDNVVVTTLPELQADQTCVVQEGDVPRDPRGGRCQQSDAMTCPFYGDGIAIASWQSCYARGPLRSVRRSQENGDVPKT